MSQIKRVHHKYTPDEMGEAEFLERFVVRTEIFDEIFKDIKSTKKRGAPQHYIIIGQRGQGKTTLLRKLQIETSHNEKVSQNIIPIKFAEEQYHIRSLCRLWEEVADHLQHDHPELFPDIFDVMERALEQDDYEDVCFSYLDSAVKKSGKQLLLLVDNIDEMLSKFSEKEQRRLREILTTASWFRIVGGSTKMLEQHFDYGKPFYQFFKIIKLKGFTLEESKRLLMALAVGEEKKKMQSIFDHDIGRIETLRRLTGGVPRTMVMLFDVFMDDGGDAFDDLLKILDEVTPLYKHRMDDLSTQLQDIVHTIAINWDGIATKDIAKRTRLDSKNTSAQLKQLEKYDIVESESIGKNKIYKIKERFFNIWYLMRFGRKRDRQRVEWLVRFLESWCSKEELATRANNLMKLIESKTVSPHYVYFMTEALSHAGLDLKTEFQLKRRTKSYLQSIESNLLEELSPSYREMVDRADEAMMAGKTDEAIKVLSQINTTSPELTVLKAIAYEINGDAKNAEKFYLQALEQDGLARVAYLLAQFYDEQKRFDEAEKYYLIAIKQDQKDAVYDLAYMYNKQGKEDKSEKYYFEAIEKNQDANAMNDIAGLFLKKGDKEKAVKYSLMAVEKGHVYAMFNLANMYREDGELEKAEYYYQEAIEEGYSEAMLNLAVMYFENAKKAEKALELIQKARENIKDSVSIPIYALILLWNEQYAASFQIMFEEEQSLDDVFERNIQVYIAFLLMRGQNNWVKKAFDVQGLDLKERMKPLWYAFVTLNQKEYPGELEKMGSELQESVDEILTDVEEIRKIYG